MSEARVGGLAALHEERPEATLARQDRQHVVAGPVVPVVEPLAGGVVIDEARVGDLAEVLVADETPQPPGPPWLPTRRRHALDHLVVEVDPATMTPDGGDRLALEPRLV